MRRLEQHTTSNVDISAVQLCHTYTAVGNRLVFMRVFVSGVQGGGDYTAYITIMRAGTSEEYYVVPLTITPVDSGYGSICLTTIALPIQNGDSVRVYVRGQASDVATGVVVEVWEDDSNFYSTAPGDFPTGSLGNALARLGTSPTIQIQVPLMDTSKLEIVRGDDYDADHGTGITLRSEQWPDLTGATVAFVVVGQEIPATVVGPQEVLVELTSAQTAVLQNGYFSLVATFSDSDEVSLIPKAKLSVISRVT